MRIKSHGGQALVELALGMLAFTLVISALVAFSNYIAAGLELQNSTRSQAGVNAINSSSEFLSYASCQKTESVEVDQIAAEYVFGSAKVNLKEEVHIPKAGILRE